MASTTKGRRRIKFQTAAPGATAVVLAGDFNNWDESCLMSIKSNGKCERTLMLPPGRYEYKFKIDNRWVCDQSNPLQCKNVHGTTNSVIVVQAT